MADRSYQNLNLTSNREGWEFEYSTKDLLSGAKEQLAYRNGRIEVWTDKKEQVMKEVREKGLTIEEPLAEKMSSYISNRGGGGAQIVVDDKLQARLDECVTKIHDHRDLVTKYAAWVQLLEQVPETRLKLKHGDWMFFFGK